MLCISSMVYRLKEPIASWVLSKCLSSNVSNEELEYYYQAGLNAFGGLTRAGLRGGRWEWWN